MLEGPQVFRKDSLSDICLTFAPLCAPAAGSYVGVLGNSALSNERILIFLFFGKNQTALKECDATLKLHGETINRVDLKHFSNYHISCVTLLADGWRYHTEC